MTEAVAVLYRANWPQSERCQVFGEGAVITKVYLLGPDFYRISVCAHTIEINILLNSFED